MASPPRRGSAPWAAAPPGVGDPRGCGGFVGFGSRAPPAAAREFWRAPCAPWRRGGAGQGAGGARAAQAAQPPRWRQPQFLLQLPHLRSPATPCGRRAKCSGHSKLRPRRGGSQPVLPGFLIYLVLIHPPHPGRGLCRRAVFQQLLACVGSALWCSPEPAGGPGEPPPQIRLQ